MLPALVRIIALVWEYKFYYILEDVGELALYLPKVFNVQKIKLKNISVV